MTFFNAQPYRTLPSDLIEQFMQGQQMGSDLQSRRAENEALTAQNRYKSNMFNEMLQQQMQQQQPMYQQEPMPMQQPRLMQGHSISADQAQDMLSSVMAQQGQPMQGQPMEMQQPMMQRQQPMPMRPNSQYIQRKLIQNQLLGLGDPKQETIDGQNYLVFPDGEFIPVGPAAPTERQKEFSKKDAEKYNKLQDEYSGLLETQSIVEGLTQLVDNPLLDQYLSSSTSYPLRAATNFYNRSTGKDDRAEYIAQLSDLGNRLVNAAAKDFKGNFTNQELNFLISQKPNANDTPIQLRTKVANLQKFMQEKMSKTEYALDRMQEGKSYREAIKEYMSQNKPSLNNNKNSKTASEEPVDESTLIAQAMQGEGPQGGNPSRPSATKGTTLLDRLQAINDQIRAPARGVAQSAYDAVKSVGNLVPEAVEYTTGYNMGRIPELQLMNPNAQGLEGLLQNVGYYGAPLAANVSALPMAAGAIGKAAQAANLGPKAAALAQALGMAGAGAAEGFALGEGNRGLGAFLGGLVGAAPGVYKGAKSYLNDFSSTGVGKRVAEFVRSGEKLIGKRIESSLQKTSKAGAKVELPSSLVGEIKGNKYLKKLNSRFKEQVGDIKRFIEDPSLQNAHAAQSALGNIQGRASQLSKKQFKNQDFKDAVDYAVKLRNEIKAAMSKSFESVKISPAEYEAALSDYKKLAELSKSQPILESLKSEKSMLDSDYAKLADAIFKDRGLTERSLSAGGAVQDAARVNALNNLLSKYKGLAGFGTGVLTTGVLGYGVNKLTRGD